MPIPSIDIANVPLDLMHVASLGAMFFETDTEVPDESCESDSSRDSGMPPLQPCSPGSRADHCRAGYPEL